MTGNTKFRSGSRTASNMGQQDEGHKDAAVTLFGGTSNCRVRTSRTYPLFFDRLRQPVTRPIIKSCTSENPPRISISPKQIFTQYTFVPATFPVKEFVEMLLVPGNKIASIVLHITAHSMFPTGSL